MLLHGLQLVIALLLRQNGQQFVDELKSLTCKRIGSLSCLTRVFTLSLDLCLGIDGLHTR